MFSDVARISSITKNMTMPTNSSVIYNTTTNAYEYFDGVAWVPFTNFQATGEPTGFPLGTDGQIDFSKSALNFNNSNRTFTISATTDFFYFYHSGREFRKVNPENIQIDDIEGLHYIYFDSMGVIQKSTTFSYDIILKNVFVSIIYWDFTNKKAIYVGDERHGCTMDAHTHARIHAESGAVYMSGMDPIFIYSGNSIVDGIGNSNTNISFGMSAGVFRDEDIIHNSIATDFNINIPIFYRNSSTIWRRREGGESIVSYRLLFDTTTSKILYNKKNGNSFSLESPSSGNFVLYHLYVINDATINKSVGSRDNKYILIAGTYEYTSKTEARYNAINEISEMENLPFIEAVALGSIIYEHNNTYTNIAKARIVSSEGQNFIDWRKKLNLKPLNALANSHNYHGGIYGKAPYYHSNQPISTTDDVEFLSVKASGMNYPKIDGQKGQVISTDGQGNLSFITVSLEDSAQTGNTFFRETTTTQNATNSITLTYPPGGKAYVWLSLDGILQSGNDFDLSGNTLTFGAQLPKGTLVDILYAKPVVLADNNANNKMTAFYETVTGVEKSTFNLPAIPSSLNSCIVFVGGAIQEPSKFNISNNVLTMTDPVQPGVQLIAYILNSSGISNSIDSYVTRQTYSLPSNGTVTISSIFGNQTSASYRFFDIGDPRISGTIYIKYNGENIEPDVRVDSNSSTISIAKDIADKLNIYISLNLVTLQNKTNGILLLRIYREI